VQLITEASAEKLRGGFYTPEPIADFLLRWGINGQDDAQILEPSCGDGIFLKRLRDLKLPYQSVTAMELVEMEAQKARGLHLDRSRVFNDDFHSFCNRTAQRFDLVVGNPPYIRYQFFDPQQQVAAEDIFIRAGLTYSRLTNAWVSFVVGSSLLLKEGRGKIAFVLPAEILQVSFAKQLRAFLAHYFNKINIISFERLVFEGVQQEVVLLLCERDGTKDHRIEHLEVKDVNHLGKLDFASLRSPQKKIDFKSNKWTFYFLDQREIDFLEHVAADFEIPTLGKFANVEVGITTGSNSFFTIGKDTVKEYNLMDYVQPLVGRSVQVDSAVFTSADWRANRDDGVRAHLVAFPNGGSKLKAGAKRYISFGEEMNIHEGYKCGVRDHWYVVPSLKISDALFIRRSHLYPRLIVNRAIAYTTDTMHRVFVHNGVSIDALVASYYNSLSLAFAEVCGRSYGGGVLELMPNEAERILLPYSRSNQELLPRIDQLLRGGEDIRTILRVTDKVVLKRGFGLSAQEIATAQGIWQKLSQRRLQRGAGR